MTAADFERALTDARDQYAAGQAVKKVEEALGAADPARRECDLLGAIAYLAFLVAWYRGREEGTDG